MGSIKLGDSSNLGFYIGDNSVSKIYYGNDLVYQTDTSPPTIPSSITILNTTETTIEISWTSSTDNISVAGYYLYLNGSLVNTDNSPDSRNYTFTGLIENTTYTLGVRAFDAAGNQSGLRTKDHTTESSIPPASADITQYSFFAATYRGFRTRVNIWNDPGDVLYLRAEPFPFVNNQTTFYCNALIPTSVTNGEEFEAFAEIANFPTGSGRTAFSWRVYNQSTNQYLDTISIQTYCRRLPDTNFTVFWTPRVFMLRDPVPTWVWSTSNRNLNFRSAVDPSNGVNMGFSDNLLSTTTQYSIPSSITSNGNGWYVTFSQQTGNTYTVCLGNEQN